ncbi:transporter, partial [Priestia megaterium]
MYPYQYDPRFQNLFPPGGGQGFPSFPPGGGQGFPPPPPGGGGQG